MSFIPGRDHVPRLVPNTRDSGPNDQPAPLRRWLELPEGRDDRDG
jgi:hypothetical protein